MTVVLRQLGEPHRVVGLAASLSMMVLLLLSCPAAVEARNRPQPVALHFDIEPHAFVLLLLQVKMHCAFEPLNISWFCSDVVLVSRLGSQFFNDMNNTANQFLDLLESTRTRS